MEWPRGRPGTSSPGRTTVHAKALRPERAQETEGSGVTRAEGGAGSEAEGRQGLGGS